MMNPRWCLVCLLLVAALRLHAAPRAQAVRVVKLAEGVYGFVWRNRYRIRSRGTPCS